MSRTISAAAKFGGSRYSLNNTTALKIASSSVPGRKLHSSIIELPFRKTLILYDKLGAGGPDGPRTWGRRPGWPENLGPEARMARELGAGCPGGPAVRRHRATAAPYESHCRLLERLPEEAPSA